MFSRINESSVLQRIIEVVIIQVERSVLRNEFSRGIFCVGNVDWADGFLLLSFVLYVKEVREVRVGSC